MSAAAKSAPAKSPAEIEKEQKAAAALQAAIAEVQTHFSTKHKPAPIELAASDVTRFLIARMNRKKGLYDVKATIDMLTAHLEWRAKTFPIQITPAVEKALGCGKLIAHGRDKAGRPVVVITGAKFDATDRTQETQDAACAAVLLLIERGISEMKHVKDWDGTMTGQSLHSVPSAARMLLAC